MKSPKSECHIDGYNMQLKMNNIFLKCQKKKINILQGDTLNTINDLKKYVNSWIFDLYNYYLKVCTFRAPSYLLTQ